MRLGIDIPDNTRPDVVARITALFERLNAQPEFVEELYPHSFEEAGATFNPQMISEVRKAATEARAGKNLSPQQVEELFATKHSAWLANHPG